MIVHLPATGSDFKDWRPSMKAQFTRHGEPLHDYTGAHAVDATGRLATIVKVYQRPDWRYMATLRRFNGEPAGEHPLATLEILERTDEESTT